MTENIVDEVGAMKQAETARVQSEAAAEVGMWAGGLIMDTDKAIREGMLVDVPDEGKGFRLIGKIRRGEEPKYLNPKALRLLEEIGSRWSAIVADWGLDASNTFVSVTSLFRGEELQDQLIKTGQNAAKISSHQAGVAIDFDPRGYYQGDDRRALNPGVEGYDVKYLNALIYTLAEMEKKGACHLIVERAFEKREGRNYSRVSCFHVCVAPGNKDEN